VRDHEHRLADAQRDPEVVRAYLGGMSFTESETDSDQGASA